MREKSSAEKGNNLSSPFAAILKGHPTSITNSGFKLDFGCFAFSFTNNTRRWPQIPVDWNEHFANLTIQCLCLLSYMSLPNENNKLNDAFAKVKVIEFRVVIKRSVDNILKGNWFCFG